MFLVEYIRPYTQQYVAWEFTTRNEAEDMAAYFRSCGTRASVRYDSARRSRR